VCQHFIKYPTVQYSLFDETNTPRIVLSPPPPPMPEAPEYLRTKATGSEQLVIAFSSSSDKLSPFGYCIEGKRLIPNVQEGFIVHEMELYFYRDKYSPSRIADELNDRGFFTRNGSRWTTALVEGVLERNQELWERCYEAVDKAA
jgi:hypothetical protein